MTVITRGLNNGFFILNDIFLIMKKTKSVNGSIHIMAD
ncbi:hypothetical protein GAPWKB30_1335 [Gilliamella apicola]|nr:hypothetical protein GAPWKB30_1335 [Gilliamella apicola]